MISERIYLDHAATTPVRRDAAEAMRNVAAVCDFNPSSLHAEGRRARALLDEARERIAGLLGASRKEIVFTASGTESNNLAIAGVARAARRRGQIIASMIEHHAVLRALEHVVTDRVDASLLPVDSAGHVSVEALSGALGPQTLLVSIMYANNEIGSVQPVAELAQVARSHGALFHTDAVQAPCWLPLDVDELGVDLLSLAAHKFGGPKGIGLLYIRHGTAIQPLLAGGGQELGRRSGTENLSGIVGMASALELAVAERDGQAKRVGALRKRLEAGIRAIVPDLRVNGGDPRLPNVLSISIPGVEATTLLVRLDLEGVAASAGSACTSGALEPSHVLAALGDDPRAGAVRFSLGTTTTEAEIERILELLPPIVTSLRRGAQVMS